MPLFTSSRPSITIKVLPRFPANVVGGSAIAVTKSGTTYTFDLDINELVVNSSIADPTNHFVPAYNVSQARIEKVRLDNLPATTNPTPRTSFGDANYTALTTDRYVGLTATLTAPRTLTVPAASLFAAGAPLIIQDEDGGISATNTLTILFTGADTADGASSIVLDQPYSMVDLRSNGSNRYSYQLAKKFSGIRVAAGTAAAPSVSITGDINTGLFSPGADQIALTTGGVAAVTFDAAGAATFRAGATLAGALAGATTGAFSGLVTLPAATTSAASLRAPHGTAPTAPTNGDIWTATDGTFARISGATHQLIQLVAGQCRLTKSGANLLLVPVDGGRLLINGKLEVVPDAGVSLGAPAAASTLYYIYAYMAAGVMTLEASTTAYSGGTGLVNYKAADATRTLVGMARSTAGTAWADSTTQRLVISWFNRRQRRLRNTFTAVRTTTSTTRVEVNSEIRVEFLVWGGDAPVFGYSAPLVQNSVGGATTTITEVTLDGAGGLASIAIGSTTGMGAGGAEGFEPAEGYHYATLMGHVSAASTGTWTTAGGAAFPSVWGIING